MAYMNQEPVTGHRSLPANPVKKAKIAAAMKPVVSTDREAELAAMLNMLLRIKWFKPRRTLQRIKFSWDDWIK